MPVKLTKNELKSQKESLKRFLRYLPTLQLKKQQLQTEIRTIEARAAQLRTERDRLNRAFESWIAVFGEAEAFDPDTVQIMETRVSTGNIAGVSIPVFEGAEFSRAEYDLYEKPLWLDTPSEKLERVLELDLEARVLDRQVELLQKELRITTQRVNLFEKVKIPETRGNIKKITVYLGDQQVAAVVRGKISKKNLERVIEEGRQ